MKHTVCSITGRAHVQPLRDAEFPLVSITLQHALGTVVTLLLNPAEAAALSQALDLAAEEIGADPDPIELPPGAVAAREKTAAAGCCTSPRPDCMGAVVPGIGNQCAALSWPAFPGEPAGAPA